MNTAAVLASCVLVLIEVEGKAHLGAHQVSPSYYNPLPLIYQPSHVPVVYQPRGCVGILNCLVHGINATNQGFITGVQGIVQGGAAAGSGIASGLGTAVGGVASGIGQGVGGVASGIGHGVGQGVGGVASGIGQGVGGAASEAGQAVGGAVTGRPKRRICVKTGIFSYYCYYV